jgi:hypothetical protein
VRLRLSYVVALLFLALLFCLFALRPHSVSAHGCAPPMPPPLPGPLVPAPVTPGIVLINEVLADPGSTWNCSEQGTHSLSTDSWVELYNPGNRPLDLYSVHARFDSGPNTFVFYLPLGAAIGPHGFLVLFPDANSRMLLPGATLRFLIGDATIDQVSLPALGADQSYARVPDGSNSWQITSSPTIDASNTSPQPTPTHTPSSNHGGNGSGSGSYGSGTGHKSSTPSLVNGTQPGWSKLQLPTSVPASTATVSAPLSVSLPSSTTNSISDTPHRILLTILVVALALMLLWCWRLFRPS